MIGLVRAHAHTIVDNTGAGARLPVLFADAGPIAPLIKYFVAHLHIRSHGWMEKVAQSVELLLEYTAANRTSYTDGEELFRGFAQALYGGTIGSQDGLDPSNLYWRPRRTRNANQILGAVANFSDWLAKQGLAAAINPPDLAPGRHELTLAMAAYEHRRSRAFLGHTRATAEQANPLVRVTPLRRAPLIDDEDRPPAFPDEHFARLLTDGFVRRGFKGHPDLLTRINVRDALITLLMHGGGLRLSECFHLWVHDVQVHPSDPTQAVVRIYHPSEGTAPDDWRDHAGRPAKSREDYLKLRHARVPRHRLYGDKEWAGWKHNLLDCSRTHSIAVTWRSPDYGRMFLLLWQRWLAERVHYDCHHPYAFISTKKGQRGGKQPGSPYTIAAFVGAHQRAIERIGLVPAKANGTTPHGHRHSMGQHLTDAEVMPAAIQRILHHSSLASQEPYTRPSRQKAAELLNRAHQRLKDSEAVSSEVAPKRDPLTQLLESGFADIDPDGLLSGPNPKLTRNRR